MTKLSTAQIKALIPTYVSSVRRIDVTNTYVYDLDPVADSKQFNAECEAWNLKGKNLTLRDLEDHIWKLWCDGKDWRREEKRTLKDDWDSFFFVSAQTGQPEFSYDLAGDFRPDLVKQMLVSPSRAEKCVFRMFVHRGRFGDNFRLEVITTPEDDEVVGWGITVD